LIELHDLLVARQFFDRALHFFGGDVEAPYEIIPVDNPPSCYRLASGDIPLNVSFCMPLRVAAT
jgi:hypothetical protein